MEKGLVKFFRICDKIDFEVRKGYLLSGMEIESLLNGHKKSYVSENRERFFEKEEPASYLVKFGAYLAWATHPVKGCTAMKKGLENMNS